MVQWRMRWYLSQHLCLPQVSGCHITCYCTSICETMMDLEPLSMIQRHLRACDGVEGAYQFQRVPIYWPSLSDNVTQGKERKIVDIHARISMSPSLYVLDLVTLYSTRDAQILNVNPGWRSVWSGKRGMQAGKIVQWAS